MRGRVAFGVAAVLVALAFSGCGGGGGEGPHVAKTLPVKGKLSYKGVPLISGSVRFEPEDIGREAHGEIRPDGTFEMSSFTQGDGAVPGRHLVGITGTVKGGRPVPLKYKSPSASKLVIDVREGVTEYPIDLE